MESRAQEFPNKESCFVSPDRKTNKLRGRFRGSYKQRVCHWNAKSDIYSILVGQCPMSDSNFHHWVSVTKFLLPFNFIVTETYHRTMTGWLADNFTPISLVVTIVLSLRFMGFLQFTESKFKGVF